jgi:outer membrane usher protein
LAKGYGSLFLSGSSQSYWQAGRSRDTSYQAGYSNSYRWGSMSLSASRVESNRGKKITQYMLMLSFPLGRSSRAPYLSSSSTYSDKGDLNNQLNVSGVLGEFNQFNYGVYGSRSRADGETSNSGGGNVQYRAASTNVSGSYSQGDGYRQIGLGLSGVWWRILRASPSVRARAKRVPSSKQRTPRGRGCSTTTETN